MPVNAVLIGVLLQLLALALFVAMDTLLKLMTLSFAVPQLMWARFLFSFIAVTIAMRVITGSLPWRSRAPASLLAPLSYTQMIWAVVAGVLVFGDAPDAITLLGMAVIAVSGLVVAVSGRDRKR